MKQRILSLSLLFLFSFVFQSCQKDNDEGNQKPGTVEFSFSAKAPSKSGAQQSSMKAAAETKTPAFVIVTIKSAAGKSVYTKEKIELFNMNGSFISKPISLLPSGYTLEEFLVADAGGNIIYAAPLTGSKKAYLVSKPLPINFSVKKDEVVKLVPEVLSTENATAEDFGYTTFGFAIVKTFDFLVGVFVYNETIQNFELTNSTLTVSANNKVVFSDTLKAITNQVSLPDGFDKYVLTVKKDGYNTYVDTLTAAELKLHFKSEDLGPLKIILTKGSSTPEKAVTMVTDQSTLKEIYIVLKVDQSYPLTINWGDGSAEQTDPNEGKIYYFRHKYLTPNQYTIKISGKTLDLVNSIYTQIAPLTSINIEEAQNLINLGVSSGKIRDINVSKNTHLQLLGVDDNLLKTLDISKNIELLQLHCGNNKLISLDLSSNNKLKELVINHNSIATLDLKNNLNLETVQSIGNPLSAINTSNCNKLKYLTCIDGQLTTLDVSQNSELERLSCYNNKLITIDISSCIKLKNFSCATNQLTTLDISKNTDLEIFACYQNQLTSIDLSKNTKLRDFRCMMNKLTSLDLSKNTELRAIYSYSNYFTSLDLSNNKEIRTVDIPNSLNSQSIDSLLSTLVSFNRYSTQNDKCMLQFTKSQVPTTGQGLIDLNTLRDTYKWEIIN